MHLVGMDVGGTNLRVGVFDGLDLVWERRFEADFAGICAENHHPLEKILEIIFEAVSQAIAEFPDISAAGMGFPGFIDPQTGRLASSPNLPGLCDVDLATPFSSRFEIPFRVENDALAAAYGEHALSGRSSLIYVGLGTGVGGGLVLKGMPYPGERGVAMEIGHLIVEPGGRPCGCGNRGCLEQYASASGVAKSYLEKTGKALNAREIASLAESGDREAIACFGEAGQNLAAALAHVLKVVDVPQVIVGGGLSQSWHLMKRSFDAKLEEDLIPVLRGKIGVAVSNSGDRAGMLGAALLTARSGSF
ncbi:MAG: ROK family protein [Burkholderiales bacterium]|nr:ROK family protein [Burkholderiales bacterium]